MELEKFSAAIFNDLKKKGYQYMVVSNISGILSEGDDVHNLFVPFKTKEEAEKSVKDNKNTHAIDMPEAEQEFHNAFKEKTGISFFVESRYLVA